MASFLEQLLALLPATSIGPQGSALMNEGKRLEQHPMFTPASDDLSWAFRLPARVQRRAAEAVENMPESANVDDRRTSGKTLAGYRKLIDSLDAAGYTQYPAAKAFARRPTAEELKMLGALPRNVTDEDKSMQQRLMEATEPQFAMDSRRPGSADPLTTEVERAAGAGLSARGGASARVAPKHLEDLLHDYVSGGVGAKDVQKVFKQNGWKVDLRKGNYEFEAVDPSGHTIFIAP